jgi:hypothetical protein
MSSGASASAPTSAEILKALREQVPEFELERWPATIVLDAFADHVADRLRAGAPTAELEPYFAFVEGLARSGDPAAENLVTVDFLEAAPWEELGGAALLGPATANLAEHADGERLPPSDVTATGPGDIHTQLLERFPALGELSFDDVLPELAQFAWEAHAADRPDVTRRAMGFAEWLAERGREDLAERAVSPLFDAAMGVRAGAGPRVAELLRRR